MRVLRNLKKDKDFTIKNIKILNKSFTYFI